MPHVLTQAAIACTSKQTQMMAHNPSSTSVEQAIKKPPWKRHVKIYRGNNNNSNNKTCNVKPASQHTLQQVLALGNSLLIKTIQQQKQPLDQPTPM